MITIYLTWKYYISNLDYFPLRHEQLKFEASLSFLEKDKSYSTSDEASNYISQHEASWNHKMQIS